MKKWKVRFKKIMDKQWTEVEQPFKTEDSAMFYAASIQMVHPNFEAQVEEICQKN